MLERLRQAFGIGRRPGAGAAARWVVVDVETGGLDPARDPLLAIGAIAVVDARIVVADSFEVLVRPPRTSSRDNILVHGIGEQAQQAGLAPAEACGRFVEWAGDAPLVAFHAAFDRAVLARATRGALGRALPNPWLDLAELAPALHPGTGARALDDWLQWAGVPVDQRHHASSDAFATAMLFVRLLAAVPAERRDPAALRRLAAQARWVPR